MSVTFWCPDAPTTEVVPYPDTDPDFVDQVSELPEINLSNSNARALLEMIGLPCSGDLVGMIQPDELSAWIERLRSLLDDGLARAPFLEPTTVNGTVLMPGGSKLAGSTSPALAQFTPRLAAMASGADNHAVARATTLDTLLLGAPDAPRAFADGSRGRPRIVAFGRGDNYLREQTARFLDLFLQAKERNFAVCWG